MPTRAPPPRLGVEVVSTSVYTEDKTDEGVNSKRHKTKNHPTAPRHPRNHAAAVVGSIWSSFPFFVLAPELFSSPEDLFFAAHLSLVREKQWWRRRVLPPGPGVVYKGVYARVRRFILDHSVGHRRPTSGHIPDNCELPCTVNYPEALPIFNVASPPSASRYATVTAMPRRGAGACQLVL